MSAIFSPCRKWRYVLTRPKLSSEAREVGVRLGAEPGPWWPDRTVLFICLNPSTADEVEDDPTVRRCIGFARRWGFERLVVCNIFAYRATNPLALAAVADPVGPDNDKHLIRESDAADMVVAAWGTHGARKPPLSMVPRGLSVERGLRALGTKLHMLGLTKGGHPKHPLYLLADTDPQEWT